jgi:Rrf2 family protein
LKCLCCLAEAGTALQVPQIAERTGVTKAETAKVLQLLSWGGFVHSKRGTKGGFWLNREPNRIKAGEVIEFFLSHHSPEVNTEDPVSRVIEQSNARCQEVLGHLTLVDIIAGRVPCEESPSQGARAK